MQNLFQEGSEKLTFAVAVPTLNAAQCWPEFEAGLKKQNLVLEQILILDS
jgi:hypothetical protein